MEENVKETPKFSKCVIKQATHYYKVLLKIGAFTLALIVLSYCAAQALIATTLYVMELWQALGVVELWQALANVPMWVYILVAITVTPFIAAITVCYVNRDEVEINKSDEEFICKD